MLKQIAKTKLSMPERKIPVARILLTLFFLMSTLVPTAQAQEPLPSPDSSDPQAIDAVLDSSIFGVEMYPVNTQGGLGYINGTYTRWVRGPEIIWKDVEATKGVYNWSAINNAVTEIQNARNVQTGASVIVIVRGTPSWAQANPPYSCGPVKQSEFPAFANFMFNLIGELSNRGITYVKHWEIWNEPDVPPLSPSDPDQFWGGCWGNPSDAYYGGGYYGEFLKAIYPTIKTKDPNAQIIIGGLSLDCDPRYPPPVGKSDCNMSKFLEGILLSGAANAFDGVAFHAFDYILKDQNGAYLLGQYNNPNWPGSAWNENGPALVQKARFVKSILAQYNVTGKFIMNTENSLLDSDLSTYSNPYPTTLETTKSYYLAQAYAAAYAEGLRANIWFDVTGSWVRNNGMVKLDNSAALDAWYAYVFIAGQAGNTLTVEQFRYLNPLSYPGVTGHEFGIIPPTSSGLNPFHVWLLWSKDGVIHNITLPYPSPAVYDVRGNVIFQNVQTLSITPQPYYIVMNPVVARSRLPLTKRSLFNGNFESGFTNWTQASTTLPTSLQTTNPVDPRDSTLQTKDTSVPSQTTSAVLGNPNLALGQDKGKCVFPNVPVGYAGLNRNLIIPPIPSGGTGKLTFNYIIYSQDTTGNTVDQFEVYLTPFDSDGNPEPTVRVFVDGNTAFKAADQCKWYRVPSAENPRNSVTSGWATATIDLAAYQAKFVVLSYRLFNRPDGWFNTYAYLDNIKVEIDTP